ncbi:hypothetical protein CEXT_168731 [Caerostris extrusa]|uniref:Uncharacterized protein n=1 Tax=Caerostris extrusa TaxID=172846 RepID=A0AAV4NLB3_CAEEX|nr:hypothetical protein CEXT_168731 [Caerostris extrusa]
MGGITRKRFKRSSDFIPVSLSKSFCVSFEYFIQNQLLFFANMGPSLLCRGPLPLSRNWALAPVSMSGSPVEALLPPTQLLVWPIWIRRG